jgi:hypothetical protein
LDLTLSRSRRRWSLAFARPSGILLLLAATMLLAALPRGAAAQEASLAGTYRDEQLTVVLTQSAQPGRPASYTGTIQLGDQKFPLKAEVEGNRLKGTFESQGSRYEFNGSAAGRMLVLTTGGTTYRLTKQSSNPLARPPAKPNPLARPAPAAVPALPRPRAESLSAASARGGAVRFTRYSVMDDPAMIGGEAFSMLIPEDWQVEGGLFWRVNPAVPAYISMRVSSPDHTESLEAFPALTFVWAEGGIPLFKPGSIYLGNEVEEPLEDPVVYIKQVLLPRFRKNLPLPQVTAAEELPKLAEAISENSKEPGLQKKFRAARVRLEYIENGRAMEEDFYCVLASTLVPSIQTTFWGPDRNYAFRAEQGKLDARSKVFQTIMSSIQPNLSWFNRYLQLIQILGQSRIEGTRNPSEFGPVIKSATTGQISEPCRQVYERQRAAQERVNASFLQYVRGLAQYLNPVDHRVVLLPSYPGAWVNGRGDYLLAQEASFDPNIGTTQDWQRLAANP